MLDDVVEMMLLAVFLSVMGQLLLLRDDCKHPTRKTKFQGYLRRERITNPTIGRQLLFHG